MEKENFILSLLGIDSHHSLEELEKDYVQTYIAELSDELEDDYELALIMPSVKYLFNQAYLCLVITPMNEDKEDVCVTARLSVTESIFEQMEDLVIWAYEAYDLEYIEEELEDYE